MLVYNVVVTIIFFIGMACTCRGILHLDQFACSYCSEQTKPGPVIMACFSHEL